MKKILILAMSCNDAFFDEQVNVIKETWAKPIIEGKYPNIDFMAYKGTTEKHKYVKDEHILYVRCEDDINNTYKKTHYALSLVDKHFDYDYIFRTNTSTFVNVDLLNDFVQSELDDKVLWTSELYSLSEAFVPYPLYLYGRGNGLLMSKFVVKTILNEGVNFLYMEKCDDWIIGNIWNSYWIKQGEDYLNHIKAYTHGWFKCIGTNAENNNSICPYYNSNTDFDFLKKFLTIQIKRYRERDIENNNYYELWNIFKDTVGTKHRDTVEYINEYTKNPNIFIGSILGYIPYEKWKATKAEDLYLYEIHHKASDDAERYKPKKMLY